jgi:sporulation protein YlmC with PRC-barrel domain
MAGIITINIGNNGAVVAIQKGDKIKNKIFVKNLTEKTEKKLQSIFLEYKSYLIYVLLDTVAQNYVHKTFPAVNRFDLVAIVNRKFKQEIPKDDLKTKFLLDIDKETGKWNYMFVSAPIVSPLKEWLVFLENLPQRTVGIYFIPMESKNFVKALSRRLNINKKWILLITQNKASDLRQVAFKNNELIFTRLLGYREDEDFARKFSSDISRTIEYLKRISADFDTKDLAILTITESRIKEILKNSQLKEITINAQTPYEAGKLIKAEQSLNTTDKFSDILIRNFFIKSKKKEIKFKTSHITLYENLYLAKKGIIISCLALLSLLSILFLYFFSYNITANYKKNEASQIIKSKEVTLKQKKQEKFGEVTINVEQVTSIGRITDLINNASINPLPIFKTLYQTKKDLFTVNEISWKINNYPYQNLGTPTSFSSKFNINLINTSGNIEDLFTIFDKFSENVKTSFSGFNITHSKLPSNIDFNSLYYSFYVDLEIKGDQSKINLLNKNITKK